MLAERNDEIFVIPDILCNAGGVIVSYFEWVQDLQQYFWSKEEVMDRLERALDRSWSMVVERARSATASPTAPPRWRSASSGCGRRSRRAGCFRDGERRVAWGDPYLLPTAAGRTTPTIGPIGSSSSSRLSSGA